jgi:8-oxo-dGTP pyrophosphatase MutT (NUDIX family)
MPHVEPEGPREAIVERQNARVILVGPGDRVFLMRITDPEGSGSVWITPGGGVHPEESHQDAARRELREETGIERGELSPPVWIRDGTIRWDGRVWHEVETFFVLRVDHEGVNVEGNASELEYRYLSDHRWWTVADIKESTELFSPRRIAELLPAVLEGRVPVSPIDAGD